MSTCGDCKHWKPPSERTGYRDAIIIIGADDKADPEATSAADVQYGECLAIDIQRDHPIAQPLPLATTLDGSEYMATLYTRAEFGCAMWEAKGVAT